MLHRVAAGGAKAAEGHNADGDYVLLEAKYYLRQTNSPIKQIAFELNFANKMDFYRYFIRHTGMTPSEYRNLPGC